MKQYYRGWEKNKSFKQIMNVLRTMHTLHKKTSGRVFMMRLFYCNTLRQVLSRKNRSRLTNKNRKLDILKYGLVENKDPIVGYYMKRLFSEENTSKLINLINEVRDVNIILNENYENKLHQLYYHSVKKNIKTKKISYQVSSEALKEIELSDATCYKAVSYTHLTLPTIE